MKCKMCEEPIKKDEEMYSQKLDGECHDSCFYEADLIGTAFAFNPKENKITKWVVTDSYEMYGENDYDGSLDEKTLGDMITEEEESCPIKFKWVSTDGWRGYFDVEQSGYVSIHEAPILAYHESQEKLKELDAQIKEEFWERGINFIIAVTRTSNVFSMGYDILVDEDHTKEAKKILKRLLK